MIDLDKADDVAPVTKAAATPPSFSIENKPKMKNKSILPLIVIFLLVAAAGIDEPRHIMGAFLRRHQSRQRLINLIPGAQHRRVDQITIDVMQHVAGILL